MTERERRLPDAELSGSVMALARRFVQRWDRYAIQRPDGLYISIPEPLTVDQLYAHLRGELTLGTYLLDEQNQARFLVLDADNTDEFTALVEVAQKLGTEAVPSYLETSRRGGHLWFFLDQAQPGRLARQFGRGILQEHGIAGMELYPKQDKLTSGPGSLIRMPFGVHRVNGRRYGFITPDGQPLAPTIREQLKKITFPQTVPKTAFDHYQQFAPEEPVLAEFEPLRDATGTVSERIKAAVTVMDFVGQFVNLKPTGSGAVGKCPFHDDQRPSLGVNIQENYWHCFAGCGGGSIIDFWMKWRDCDFTTAVTELAGMLL